MAQAPPQRMSAQTGSSSVWVWCPANEKDLPFQHPSDVPTNDEALAKVRFVDEVRGPRLARINPATLLQTKGNLALIAEKGATREVPRSMVLPWYEGLLLLQELEAVAANGGKPKADWCTDELRQVLEQERSKFRDGQLRGSFYTERRLMNMAITGSHFVDGDNREWAYRRENLRTDLSFVETAEDEGGFFRIRDVTGYMPPWEAFCHEKCGFYQDFYQVRWEHPFSEIDYSAVENGCTEVKGATWEPDECLPAHLDGLRRKAKSNWVKQRRELEEKMKSNNKKRELDGDSKQIKRQLSTDGDIKVKEEREDKKFVKLAKVRRDETPLERDLIRSRIGHDFSPGEAEKQVANIRSGWPKTAAEYPKGYGVADPPGFCMKDCDCMDDQRPQLPWETKKAWLEDAQRSQAALASIEALSGQTSFVRRRGQVSKMCFFETANSQNPDETHPRAALGLAAIIEAEITKVLRAMPLAAFRVPGDAIRIPVIVFSKEDQDYDALRCEAPANAPLPPWAQVDMDDGQLRISDAAPAGTHQLRVEFAHAEGVVGTVTVSVTSEAPANPVWAMSTLIIVGFYSDMMKCKLEKAARQVLFDHFQEVYNFEQRQPRQRRLGEWLEIMARILRMLRSSASSNITV